MTSATGLNSMKLTREKLRWRLLICELALCAVGFAWLAHSTRSFLVGFLGLIFIVLLATTFWIEVLIRRDVTNFQVCIVLGFFIFAADFWFFDHRAIGATIGVAGMGAATWLLNKLLRPIDDEQQIANLAKYRAQRELASNNRGGGLANGLGGFLVVVPGFLYIWAKQGPPKGPGIWILFSMVVFEIGKVILLRYFPSEADGLQAVSTNGNE